MPLYCLTVDINRLRVFRSVVASGSVQAAAHNLGYTPSAVSQQLKQLQSETGLQLFERSGRGIVPTPAGTLLATQSEAAMSALSQLDGVIEDLRAGRTGSLSIGCFASAGEEWIPTLAHQLLREFPDVHLDIDLTEIVGPKTPTTPTTDLEIRTEVPEEHPAVPGGYTRIELVTEPYYAILPAGHRLLDSDAVSMAEVAEESWIDESSGGTCARILQRAVRSAGVSPRVVAHCRDHHTSMALVAAGVGVALAPRLTLGALPAGTQARPILDPTPERRIAVLVRDAAAANPATQRAVALLREIAVS